MHVISVHSIIFQIFFITEAYFSINLILQVQNASFLSSSVLNMSLTNVISTCNFQHLLKLSSSCTYQLHHNETISTVSAVWLLKLIIKSNIIILTFYLKY